MINTNKKAQTFAPTSRNNFLLFAKPRTNVKTQSKVQATSKSAFGRKKQKVKKESSGAFREFIAKLSKGLMLPIAILPIAGLFLGIGAAISGQVTSTAAKTIGNVIMMPGQVVFGALPVLFAIAIAISFSKDSGTAALSAFVGWIVFCALQSALIIQQTDSSSQVTGYWFLWYHFTANGAFNLNMFPSIFGSNIGIQSLNTSVFGGMVIGGIASFMYNKFKDIQLPQMIGFFSGVRFIPIITFVASLGASLVFAAIWPLLGLGLYWAGIGFASAPGGISGLVYGILNRVLVPFGLHHVLNTTFWFNSTGGTFDTNQLAHVIYNGQLYSVFLNEAFTNEAKWFELFDKFKTPDGTGVVYSGDINVFINMLTAAGHKVNLHSMSGGEDITNISLTFDMIFRGTEGVGGTVTCNPGQFTTGAYGTTLFALPAAALAMIMAAPKGDGRKMALSICGSAGFVCFLTGITEPIEFTFLLLAPYLYWGFHAVMAGISYMICIILSVYTNSGPHVGFSFSAGLLDFTIYGIVPDAVGSGTNCFYPLIISMCYAPIYYFVFYFVIIKKNLATPGRDGSTNKLFTKSDFKEKKNSSSSNDSDKEFALKIIKAYGGLKNIKNVDACITKLRIQVADQSKVNKEELMKLGARGVMKPSPQSVYAVFGTKADFWKNQINKIISNG